MQKGSKEFYDMLENFEKSLKIMPIYIGAEIERSKNDKMYYENGKINDLFIAFQHGYALGRCNYLNN